ncbi:MAG: hypothetical protein IIC91_14660, partial [Chloroflexi bacterium]|nr:hypothetical protein [Chloroflexota bacterium]
YFLWRYSYYDFLLPNTYYAKVGLNLAALDRGLEHVTASGLQYQLGAMVVGLAILAANRHLRQDAAYLLTLTGVMLAGVVVEGGDTHARFITPLLPLLYLGGLAGFATLLRRAALPRAQTLAIAGLALALGGLALLPASQDALLPFGRRSIEERRQLGEWLNENTPPDYVIADFAIGATAYYAIDRDFLDMFGLNDVVIAHTEIPGMGSGITGHEKYNADYVYDEVRPEIIVVAQVRAEPLTADELLQSIRETSLLPASYFLLTDARLWRDYEVRALDLGGRWMHLLQRRDTVPDLQSPRLR